MQAALTLNRRNWLGLHKQFKQGRFMDTTLAWTLQATDSSGARTDPCRNGADDE